MRHGASEVSISQFLICKILNFLALKINFCGAKIVKFCLKNDGLEKPEKLAFASGGRYSSRDHRIDFKFLQYLKWTFSS